MGKRTKAGIWITVIVLLGFLRGYLFGNINWVYKTLTENRPLQAREEFHFLLEWPASQIMILKWMLTFLFFGAFAFLTWLIIKILYEKKEYNRITLLIFAALLGVSAVLYVFYFILGSPLNLYLLIRTIMGIGQSFMPLMLLAIAFKFLPQASKID